MEHVEYDFMEGMDEESLQRRLRDHETGVLALARDGDAYAFPVSFASLGGTLYVRLARDADSRKFDYLEETGEACLVVHGVSDERAWSIIASGPLRPVEDVLSLPFDDAAINEAFGPLHVFDQPIEDLEVTVYELDPELLTGRQVQD